MKPEEKFLIDNFNKCIPMTHDDYPDILHVYDKKILRQRKLNRVLNENTEIKLNPSKDSSIILFRQDYKNNYFWVNYDKIWSLLESKYGLNSQEIKELIKGTLLEPDKMKALTPDGVYKYTLDNLLEPDKMKALTPPLPIAVAFVNLLEPDKMKALTPAITKALSSPSLLEPDKMKALTPKCTCFI